MKPYYQEPNIKIYCGDCLDILKDIDDNSIDLVLTDPPYNIGYQSNMRTRSSKFNLIVNDDNDFRTKIYPTLYNKLKNNSACLIFCSFKNYAVDYIVLSKYFEIKNNIIWYKPGGGIGDLEHSLLTDYEMILVGHKGRCKIRGKRLGSVWRNTKVNPNKMIHPTEKPTSLINRLIEKFSDVGDVVLDPFFGSGTTLRACKDLGRKCIGIEISKEYCDIAVKRLAQEVLPL